MQELSAVLRRLRGGMSLREAAKRSGLSYSYISSLEKGKHPRTGAAINPTPEILRSLAKAYNYPHEDLMKLAGYIDYDDNEVEIEPESEIEIKRKEIMKILNSTNDMAEIDLTLDVIKRMLGK